MIRFWWKLCFGSLAHGSLVRVDGRTQRARLADNTADERGLSLVEVIVATAILGIGIVGAASVLAASSRTVSTAGHRAQASHLATSELETVRSTPYPNIAIDPAATGFVRHYASRDTVVPELPPTPDRALAMISPVETVAVDEMEFLVTRHVTWQEVPSNAGLDPYGYKVINIIVQWTDSAGTHQVEQESGLFAGALS